MSKEGSTGEMTPGQETNRVSFLERIGKWWQRSSGYDKAMAVMGLIALTGAAVGVGIDATQPNFVYQRELDPSGVMQELQPQTPPGHIEDTSAPVTLVPSSENR